MLPPHDVRICWPPFIVDCAAPGRAWFFVEAGADITVDELSDVRCPPFLFFEFIGDHVYRALPLGVLLAAVAD